MGVMEPSLKLAQATIEVDKSPAVTVHAREILQSVLDGKFDRTTLTPDFAKQLTPELLANAKDQIGQMGGIKMFTFLREAKFGELTSRIYRVGFAGGELTLAVAINKDGKIGGLEIHQ